LDISVGGAAAVTVFKITANLIESIDIDSSENPNTITTLVADKLQTLTITGDDDLTITNLTAANLSKINATDADGSFVMGNQITGVTGSVQFLGGSSDDTFLGTKGDVFRGNGGADILTAAAANAALDTFVYAAQSDSTLNAFDKLGNFVSTEDSIDLGAFDFTGVQTSALASKGALAAIDPVPAGQDAAVDFFRSGGFDRAVAWGTNGGNVYVYVDANKDGDFTAADDMVIEVTGVGAVTLADFGF